MNLAHERIAELCGQLKLSTVANALPHLTQKAVSNDTSFFTGHDIRCRDR